jgi:hypothetical protein
VEGGGGGGHLRGDVHLSMARLVRVKGVRHFIVRILDESRWRSSLSDKNCNPPLWRFMPSLCGCVGRAHYF